MTGDHYFSPQPQADHRYQRFQEELRGREFTFITDEGVFSKKRVDPGTRLLIESIAVPEEGSFLDLGCGYGPIGIVLGSLAPQAVIHMVDVNSRAVELARRNLGENGITNARIGAGTRTGTGSDQLIACNPYHTPGGFVLLEEAYRAFSRRACTLSGAPARCHDLASERCSVTAERWPNKGFGHVVEKDALRIGSWGRIS